MVAILNELSGYGRTHKEPDRDCAPENWCVSLKPIKEFVRCCNRTLFYVYPKYKNTARFARSFKYIA